NSVFDVTLLSPVSARPSSTVCIRNVAPAPFLAPRFAAARSTVLFSAAIGPQDLQTRILGLPASTGRLNLESPFSNEQLRIEVAAHISTRWHARTDSLAPIAQVIGQQFQRLPGLYLA